jgi:hypothetical protein
MKATNEGSLENYDDAVKDALAVYSVESSNSSSKFLRENSLWAAASFECHAGRINSGIDHARQVIKESSPTATDQPYFVNTAQFTLAECFISEAENSTLRQNVGLMNQADGLLKNLNIPLVSSIMGSSDFEGIVDVAEARLSLLRKDPGSARRYALKAAPFVNKPGGDPYEKKVLARVQISLRE